mgnify:CR=1 FL=1
MPQLLLWPGALPRPGAPAHSHARPPMSRSLPQAPTGDSSLCPRERAALERALLEEVAERTAAEQVAEFVRLAAAGQLHPRAPSSGGAGLPPSQAAH